MKKLGGILAFLLILYAILLIADESARSARNHFRLGERIGLEGILSLAAGILIISGGIDLSIGSLIGLLCTLFCMMLRDWEWPLGLALPTILGAGAAVGLIHGVMVAKVRLQPFIVTLCGLFIYRGLARWIAKDRPRGLGSAFAELRNWLNQEQLISWYLIFLLLLMFAAIVFLHFSKHGRYLFAIGSNEQAARYSGIATDAYKILAYVICSTLVAVYSILYVAKFGQSTPSSEGSFKELYAIAGAVLGGCSLRGGEGNVVGMLIGTCIIIILPNLVTMWGFSSQLEFFIIGAALFLGAVLDELMRRRNTVRR